MNMKWYDTEDWTPHAVCEVELSDGRRRMAVFVCGDWETLEGEVIYPVRFRPLRINVSRGLYSFTVDGDE
jgi:hypothetical protein